MKTKWLKVCFIVFWSLLAVPVYAGPITKIVFTSDPQVMAAGITSQIMTIQTQDQYGNRAPVDCEVTVRLYTDSLEAVFLSQEMVIVETVTISSGTAEVSFYYQDRMAGSPTIIADEDPSSGWTAAEQEQIIIPGQPAQLVFTTPPRTLVAGTTSQVMTVEVQDEYGNTTTVSENTTLKLYSTHEERRSFGDLEANWGITQVVISAGQNSASFYYKDENAGPVTIKVYEHPSHDPDWEDAIQQQTITPAEAHHFEISHDGAASVYWPEVITVRAKDEFGNYATGHPVTGNYYLGTASFTTTGSAVCYPTSYKFTTSDAGQTTFQVTDTIVEEIHLTATDISTPTITGTTSPEHPLSIYGVIVEPKSLIPTCLYQGYENQAVMRFELKVRPEPGGGEEEKRAYWSKLRVDKTGDALDREITKVALWKDYDKDGEFNAQYDLLLDSGNFVGGTIWFDLAPDTQIIDSSLYHYFVTYDIDEFAEPGRTVGLYCKDKDYFTLIETSEVEVSAENFPIYSSTATICPTPGTVTVVPYSLVHDTDTFLQASQNIGFERLTMFTDKYTEIWTGIKLFKIGTGPDSDVQAIEIYTDKDDDGIYKPAVDDVLISSGEDKFIEGISTIYLTELQEIGTTPQNYFIVLSLSPSAEPDKTVGVKCRGRDHVYVATSIGGEPKPEYVEDINFPIVSGKPTTQATVDTLTPVLKDRAPAQVTQGDKNMIFAQIDAEVDANAVSWKGLKVKLIGNTTDADIDAVNVYYWVSGSTNAAGEPILNIEKGDSRITTGEDKFENGVAQIEFISGQEILLEKKIFLLSLDINRLAGVENEIGVSIEGNDWFIVEEPDLVGKVGAFTAGPCRVTDYPDELTVTGYDLVWNKQLWPKPGIVYQNAKDVPFLRLDLVPSLSEVTWTGIKLDRTGTSRFLVPPEEDPNSDVSNIKIYYDADDSGILEPAHDVWISSTTVNKFHEDKVEITLSQPQVIRLADPAYPKPERYFVALDINDTATPKHTIGVQLLDNSHIMVNGPNSVGTTSFAIRSSTAIIKPSKRILSINATDIAPEEKVTQGDESVGIMKLQMRVDSYEVPWTGISFTRTGTGKDEDISGVEIWYDKNESGDLNPAAGYDVRVGTGTFVAGTCRIIFPETQWPLIPATTVTYFIAFSIADNAEIGNTVGLQCSGATRIFVEDPHAVFPEGFPWDSGRPHIEPTLDRMLVEFRDFAPGEITQGDKDVLILGLILSCDAHNVEWTKIRLERIGTGSDEDVAAVKVYKDGNGNGTFDLTVDTITGQRVDPQISYGTEMFHKGEMLINLKEKQVLTTGKQNYFITFDIAALAQVGKTLGLAVRSPSYLTVISPDEVMAENFPFDTIKSLVKEYASTVTITPWRDKEGKGIIPLEAIRGDANVPIERFSLRANISEACWQGMRIKLTGTERDEDVKAIKIFADNGNDVFEPLSDTLLNPGEPTVFVDKVAEIMFTTSTYQTIGDMPKTYYIVYDIALECPAGTQLGPKWNAPTWFYVTTPNKVSEVGFPLVTTLLTVKPINVILSVVDLTGSRGVRQGETGVPMLKISLSVDHYQARLDCIRFEHIGQGAETIHHISEIDDEITAIKMYLDNGDGVFNVEEDTLVSRGSDVMFIDGMAWVDFVPEPQIITTATKNYFVVCDFSQRAGCDNQHGLQIHSAGHIQLVPGKFSEELEFPLKSGLVTILSIYTPTTPQIYINAWTNSLSEVHVTWESAVVVEWAKDTRLESYYAIGTCSMTEEGRTNIVPWTPIGDKMEVLVTGLSLRQNHIYFFSVKTVATSLIIEGRRENYWSYVASVQFRVDITPPQEPKPPSLPDEITTDYTVEWTLTTDPESGVVCYELQEKVDTSPVWKSVKSDIPADQSSYNITNKASGHFYYYRVRAKNAAGSWSEWSQASAPACTGFPAEVITKFSNYPNPFNPINGETTITYLLNQDAKVEVSIYDLNGELVKEWDFDPGIEGKSAPGGCEVPWDGKNEQGRAVANGVYICRIVVEAREGRKTSTRKILVIKK